MTLATTSNKITYVGNGATTVFSYTFPILDSDDLVVVLTIDGVDEELASNLYSATGIGSSGGGTVTYPLTGSPLASPRKLTILRRLAAVQETDLTNQSTLYATAIETALDRLVMLSQQNSERLDRALVFSVADDSDEIVLPDADTRAGKYLSFDDDGNPSVSASIDATGLTISAFWLATVALANEALSRTALGIGVTGTLGQAGADMILGNPTGSTADPTYNSLVSYLARLGATRGMSLRRGASAWEALALGNNGQFLGSNGTDLTYLAPPIGEGLYRNLSVESTTDTAVVVSADWITLADASNNVKLVRSVSATIDASTSGLNGLDTGSRANDTWYAVWIIHNPTTNVTGTLLSLSSSAPTLPTDYTFRHRVGWVKTQSASVNLRRIRQKNAEAQYVTTASVAVPTLVSGTNTVSGATVPSTAVMICVQGSVTAWASSVYIRPNTSISPEHSHVYHSTNSANINTNQDLGGGSAWFVLEGTTIQATLFGTSSARVYGWKDSI